MAALSAPVQKLVDLALAWRLAHMQRVRTEEAKLEFRKAWGAMPMELGQEAFLEIDRLTRELAAERARLDWCAESVATFDRPAPGVRVVVWVDDVTYATHVTRGSDWRSTIDEAMREDREIAQDASAEDNYPFDEAQLIEEEEREPLGRIDNPERPEWVP
jgi:hypothetical protein